MYNFLPAPSSVIASIILPPLDTRPSLPFPLTHPFPSFNGLSQFNRHGLRRVFPHSPVDLEALTNTHRSLSFSAPRRRLLTQT